MDTPKPYPLFHYTTNKKEVEKVIHFGWVRSYRAPTFCSEAQYIAVFCLEAKNR